MKNNCDFKPILLGGAMGAFSGFASGYIVSALMKNSTMKDSKRMIIFSVVGLIGGLAVGYYVGNYSEPVSVKTDEGATADLSPDRKKAYDFTVESFDAKNFTDENFKKLKTRINSAIASFADREIKMYNDANDTCDVAPSKCNNANLADTLTTLGYTKDEWDAMMLKFEKYLTADLV